MEIKDIECEAGKKHPAAGLQAGGCPNSYRDSIMGTERILQALPIEF
ncbi:MAG: hypothetical protein NT178_02745 [Proteobacteria bacterium]|nr:hypothetical protein [Pseudomonadota bacterium]